MSRRAPPKLKKGRVPKKIPEGETAETILTRLRATGYLVAVHNDYRLKGQFMTFWLLTHHDGTWIKGEGKTDRAALFQAEQSITKPTGAGSERVEFLVELADRLEGMSCDFYNEGDDIKSGILLSDTHRLRKLIDQVYCTKKG